MERGVEVGWMWNYGDWMLARSGQRLELGMNNG
jgi:hypothetical protein